jgi:hypothetical protein
VKRFVTTIAVLQKRFRCPSPARRGGSETSTDSVIELALKVISKRGIDGLAGENTHIIVVKYLFLNNIHEKSASKQPTDPPN